MRVAEVIGDNVHALRRAAGLTQAELADAMREIGFGWQRQTVAETEAGRRDISVEELVTIAAFFEMPLFALLASPGGQPEPDVLSSGIDVGDRSIAFADWLRLIEQRRGPLDRASAGVQRAIDALVGAIDRPWARRWRRKGNGPESFMAAREERLGDRRRYPGPIFLWRGDGDFGIGATIRPWGQEVRIEFRSGVPYVARDEEEAERLAAAVLTHPDLVVISRQEAYRLRQRKGD